jgi:hypothetical protein
MLRGEIRRAVCGISHVNAPKRRNNPEKTGRVATIATSVSLLRLPHFQSMRLVAVASSAVRRQVRLASRRCFPVRRWRKTYTPGLISNELSASCVML